MADTDYYKKILNTFCTYLQSVLDCVNTCTHRTRFPLSAYTPHSTRYFSCSSVGVILSTYHHFWSCCRDSR